MKAQKHKAKIIIIAAMDPSGVIGKNGGLPWDKLPGDLSRFKDTTTGHTVVMGRKTFESIGKALPGRTNIVISRQKDWSAENVKVFKSLAAAIQWAEAHPTTVEGKDRKIFIIGGGQIYLEAFRQGIVHEMILTVTYAEYQGETFFPKFDPSLWQKKITEYPELGYKVIHYTNPRIS